jgi:hypothetical protein
MDRNGDRDEQRPESGAPTVEQSISGQSPRRWRMSGKTREAYCPTCDEETTVLRTVSYQDDTCSQCGSAIPDEETES